MKYNTSKIYLSIIATLNIVVFSPSLLSAEDKQTKKIVDESIDEVIVTGIRASLESALEAKRALSNLTEVINADDIGKLPDENIAEVLENIPGIQIDREGGIGSQVSVRGSTQNRVEINGRSTTPATDARGGISFTDLPSTLVRSLNVVKVPTADMVEGSLGGTINVKTYRGLKLRKPLKVVRVKSEYAENADKWNENFSATFGDKFSTSKGDVGAIINLSYMDKYVREDVLRVSPGIRSTAQSTVDLNDDGTNDPYYKPGYSSLEYGMRNIVNSAISGSLEWQAQDDLKFYAEGSFTDINKQDLKQIAAMGAFSSDMERDDPNATFRTVEAAGYRVPMLTSGIIGGGVLNGRADLPSDTIAPNDGVRIRARNQSGSRDTQSYVAAFGGEWDTDELNIIGEISAAGSDTTVTELKSIFQFQNDPESVLFHDNYGLQRVPFYYTLEGDVLAYGPHTEEYNERLIDPAYWSLYQVKDIDTYYKNREVAAKIDSTMFLDNPFWTSVKAGVRYTDRLSERGRLEQATDVFPGISGLDFEEYLVQTPGDFFSFNENGSYLDNFLTVDPLMGVTYREDIRDLVSLDRNGYKDPLQAFKVDENTLAYYIRGDFETDFHGIPARGNIGIRNIRTRQVSDGNKLGSEVDGDQIKITSEDVTNNQNYSHDLPSASLVLAPTEKLQLRFGYAQIIRRPNFADLSPTLIFPLSLGTAVREGNPKLKPTEAEQFDLGVEYYFRKGSVASIGFYKKNLKSVINGKNYWQGICNPRIEFRPDYDPHKGLKCAFGQPGVKVNRIEPQSLTGGTIKGVELSFLHYFRNLPNRFRGLGVVANYAYQSGERDCGPDDETCSFSTPNFLQVMGEEEQQFPLGFVRLSENSYNFTLFYERYRLNWRLRYTYRDNFLLSPSIDIANGQPLYTADRGQLNGSLSYKINKIFTVTFAGVNLLKSRKTNPGVFHDGPIARMSDSDRRISLGIRAKF